jgi:hypothetical protein
MHPTGMWAMGRDFVNYWAGARLAVSGEADLLMSPQSYYQYLQSQFGSQLDVHNWSYPPHTLLFIWPLGFLPYLAAFAVWIGAGLGSFYYACRKLTANKVDSLVLLLAPATFICIYTGQNGFFTATLILLAFAFRKDRPVLAGILIGCLTFKPQLGLFIPLILILTRQWTIFLSAAITTLALIGTSIAIFGSEVWVNYLTEIIPQQQEILELYNPQFTRMVPSAFMAAKNIGVPIDMAWVIQYAMSALIFCTVIWGFYKKRPPQLQFALFCTASALFSPYVANYDLVILAPAAYLFYSYLKSETATLATWVWPLIFAVYLIPWLGQKTQEYGVPTYFVILVAFHCAILLTMYRAPVDGQSTDQMPLAA